MKPIKVVLEILSKKLPSENKLPFLTLAFTLSALVLTVVAVGQQQNLIQNAAEQEICPTESAEAPDNNPDENPDGSEGNPDRQATRAAREATRAARQDDGNDRTVTQGPTTRVTVSTGNASQGLSNVNAPFQGSSMAGLSLVQKDQVANGIRGQLIVKYKEGKGKKNVEDKVNKRKGKLKKRNDRLKVDVVQVGAAEESATISELRQDPDVAYVERDYPSYGMYTPNDKHFNQQYGLHNTGQTIGSADPKKGKADIDIDAPEAWDKTQGGVTVAVIDSGIDSSHPDLQGQIVGSKNFSTASTAEDGFGHGTFVAGIIAAKTNNNEGIAGVCPKCKLLNARVLDDNNSVQSQEPEADAIMWAVDQGAKVINISIGGQQGTKILEEAVNYAWSKGVIIVVSAGNCGGDNYQQNGCQTKNPLMYPAAFENSIAVGAVDNNGNKASFSEYGDWVDVVAPGVDIASTTPTKKYKLGGGNGSLNYAYFHGTSFAAPYVAGVAALAMSEGNPSASDVRKKIESTAENIQGSGSKHGLVKASAVLGASSSDPDDPKKTKTPKPCKSPKPTKDKNKPDKNPKPTKVSNNDNQNLICRLAPNLSQCKKRNEGCDDGDVKKKNEDKKVNDKNKKENTESTAQNTETIITITEDGGTKRVDQSGGDGNKKESTSPDGSSKDKSDPCEGNNDNKNKDKEKNKGGGNSLLCRLAPFLRNCKDGGSKNDNNNNNNKNNGGKNKCEKNNDCKNDEICKGGKCEKKNTNQCKNNNDCAGDKVCRQGKCEKKEVQGAATQRELDPSSAMNVLEYNILYACMAKEKSCTPELMKSSDRNNDGVVDRLDYETLIADLKR